MMFTIIHLGMILWVLCLNLEGETMKKIIIVNIAGKKSLTSIQIMLLTIITIVKLGVVMDITMIMNMKGRPDMMAAMTILVTITTIDLEITNIAEMMVVKKIMTILAGVMILIMKEAV